MGHNSVTVGELMAPIGLKMQEASTLASMWNNENSAAWTLDQDVAYLRAVRDLTQWILDAVDRHIQLVPKAELKPRDWAWMSFTMLIGNLTELHLFHTDEVPPNIQADSNCTELHQRLIALLSGVLCNIKCCFADYRQPLACERRLVALIDSDIERYENAIAVHQHHKTREDSAVIDLSKDDIEMVDANQLELLHAKLDGVTAKFNSLKEAHKELQESNKGLKAREEKTATENKRLRQDRENWGATPRESRKESTSATSETTVARQTPVQRADSSTSGEAPLSHLQYKPSSRPQLSTLHFKKIGNASSGSDSETKEEHGLKLRRLREYPRGEVQHKATSYEFDRGLLAKILGGTPKTNYVAFSNKSVARGVPAKLAYNHGYEHGLFHRWDKHLNIPKAAGDSGTLDIGFTDKDWSLFTEKPEKMLLFATFNKQEGTNRLGGFKYLGVYECTRVQSLPASVWGNLGASTQAHYIDIAYEKGEAVDKNAQTQARSNIYESKEHLRRLFESGQVLVPRVELKYLEYGSTFGDELLEQYEEAKAASVDSAAAADPARTPANRKAGTSSLQGKRLRTEESSDEEEYRPPRSQRALDPKKRPKAS